MSERIHLFNISQIGDAIKAITNLLLSGPVVIDVKRARRSLSQNALFHKWCEEIAQFFVSRGKTHFASGKPMNRDTVKANLKETFLGTQMVEYIDLKTGEVKYREEVRHTSDLDTGEMCAFMTCADKWATEWGVPLSRPADSEYMNYMREQGEAA